MTCDKIHYLPILRKHNLVCTCRVLCMSKIPTIVWRRSDSDTCVSCEYFCFGREKMSFLFVTIILKRVQFMTSEFRCTVWFHFIRSVWPAILGVLFHAASWHGETNVIMKLSHYAIILTMKSRCMWFQKIRLRGFEKWIFFYNHYFWVFVFISESLKDILVFNFLFCIIYPIQILIIKPWFYLW